MTIKWDVFATGRPMAPEGSKQRIRDGRWEALRAAGVARFPGAVGRIPNFTGAERAAERLSETAAWRRAVVLKCNPDSPQRPVRARALREGKVVYMAVPRLRELRCFIELDPASLSLEELKGASTIKGAFRAGKAVRVSEMRPVDLIVVGSVAVNRAGGRIGKGGGYADLEYALGREFGFVGGETPILTTVHPLQVIEGEIPKMAHDIPVDIIVTSEEVIETAQDLPRPMGIYWDLLPREKLEAIPVLQRLQESGK
jgi:5-formyltetrahydrofolate cyclo-ligase